MATVLIDKFQGILPRVHPTLLPQNYATVANNLVLKNGKVVPLKDPSENTSLDLYLENGLQNVSNSKTIYVWNRIVDEENVQTVLAWPGIVTVARSNIADDDRDRIFVSGETGIPHAVTGADQPCVYLNNRSDGTITRRTLIKTPPAKPTITNITGGSALSTYFYQTWVDKYGYESPVSEASDIVDYDDGDEISIGATTKPDTQAVTRRIYKTITGDKTEDNRFIVEFSGDGAWDVQTFSIKDEKAGEAMPIIEAPNIRLQQMTYVPGGYYVGFSESNPSTVMFSEVGLPYSWPTSYQYDVSDHIVSVSVAKNTVFVLTDNYVWILRGTSPDTMVMSSITSCACVSPRSVCIYNNNVYFASNYGLCCVSNSANDGDVVRNVTDNIFTRDQWQALEPENLHCCVLDGRIMLFFSNASYIIDLNEQEICVTTHDERAKCACVDSVSDTLCFVRRPLNV